MAFLSATAVSLRTNTLSTRTVSARSHFVGARVAPVSARVANKGVVRMETDWTGPAPPSSVLGIGANTASTAFIGGSVIAFAIGAYCVYSSNLVQPLSPGNMNALYIIGSLGLPISWGLHVAGWIQKKNNK